MEDLFDLVNKRQELNDKFDEIKLQLRDIDKKIELSKKEHANEIFENVKPLLKNLEEIGYFVTFQHGKSFKDPYTDSYYNLDNYYYLEKM